MTEGEPMGNENLRPKTQGYEVDSSPEYDYSGKLKVRLDALVTMGLEQLASQDIVYNPESSSASLNIEFHCPYPDGLPPDHRRAFDMGYLNTEDDDKLPENYSEDKDTYRESRTITLSYKRFASPEISFSATDWLYGSEHKGVYRGISGRLRGNELNGRLAITESEKYPVDKTPDGIADMLLASSLGEPTTVTVKLESFGKLPPVR